MEGTGMPPMCPPGMGGMPPMGGCGPCPMGLPDPCPFGKKIVVFLKPKLMNQLHILKQMFGIMMNSKQ